MRNVLHVRAAEQQLVVVVEPWADEFVLSRGEAGRVVAVHPNVLSELEVEIVRDQLIVTINDAGATFEFWRNERLEYSTTNAIPYWRSALDPGSQQGQSL